jgi:hypothetical protein
LAEAGQFAEASDVLMAAVVRAGHDQEFAAELRLAPAGVFFDAGSYRRALGEFAAAGTVLAEAGRWSVAIARLVWAMADGTAGTRRPRASCFLASAMSQVTSRKGHVLKRKGGVRIRVLLGSAYSYDSSYSARFCTVQCWPLWEIMDD